MRRSGTLLHISSLPGKSPIGTMGQSARDFVDFLAASGQRVWQVLPVNPPASFQSPYSAHSVFAGSPLLIDLEALERDGLLPAGSVDSLPQSDLDQVNFAACGAVMDLLWVAFRQAGDSFAAELEQFRQKHAFWLEDYAVYMAIYQKQGRIAYQDWPALIRAREPGELAAARRLLARQIEFWIFVQYIFFTQWESLHRYAAERGISIMGDMPIYTAADSADVWANTDVFLLDASKRPKMVAGVPPDAFSEDGQRWGNPLYNWEYLRQTKYRWWIERLRVASSLYDEIRIDHFRGLDEFYAIPASEPTAKNGSWMPGPGADFFHAVYKELPDLKLLAEDLGTRTEGVRNLLEESGLPGMNVLLFAFDPHGQSDYLPHNHKPHSISYIGTHDNDTAMGWVRSAPPDNVLFAVRYLSMDTREGYHWGLIRGLYGSVSDTAIVQMQDFLGLDNAARMNTPATVGGSNWAFRMRPDALTDELADRISRLGRLYGRCGSGPSMHTGEPERWEYPAERVEASEEQKI